MLSKEKDSRIKQGMTNTQLDVIDVSPSREQIILVSENNSESPLSSIDLMNEEFTIHVLIGGDNIQIKNASVSSNST